MYNVLVAIIISLTSLYLAEYGSYTFFEHRVTVTNLADKINWTHITAVIGIVFTFLYFVTALFLGLMLDAIKKRMSLPHSLKTAALATVAAATFYILGVMIMSYTGTDRALAVKDAPQMGALLLFFSLFVQATAFGQQTAVDGTLNDVTLSTLFLFLNGFLLKTLIPFITASTTVFYCQSTRKTNSSSTPPK